MVGETIIAVVGNLTADPELRSTKNGRSVAGFTIASTPRTFDRQSNQWVDGDALFLRCTVWGDLAELALCDRAGSQGAAWHGWSVWQSVLRPGGLYGRSHRCRCLVAAV